MRVSDPRTLDRLIVSHHEAAAARLRGIIRSTGALLKGHFALDPNRHSPYFVRFSQIGWNRSLTEEVAQFLYDAAPFARRDATIVCAETSAIFLARALGQRTGNPVVVTAVDRNRHPTGKIRTGRIAPDRPLLVVSDVITTGRSLRPLIRMGRDTSVIGIVAFAVLSTARFDDYARSMDLETEWLVSSTWQTATPSDCPGCAMQLPLFPAGEFS